MADLAAVAAAAERLVAAFGSGDVDAYFDCFAQDATFVFHPERERIASREQYRELWRAWERDSAFRVLACESSDRSVIALGPDAGLFVHDVDTRVSTSAGTEALRERESIVFVRRGGRWLAVHEHLSPRP